MGVVYTEEHEIFRKTFRKFVEKEITPNINQWEEDRMVPRSIWKSMGEQGFLCPWVPEEYGGSGVGFEYSIIMAEEMANCGASLIGFGLHSDIIVPYIASYGTEEQKKKYLPGCCSGDIVTAVAMTEPDVGSDLQAIKTTALKDGDDYIVNGAKTFISNGICCDLVVVACKTDPKADPAFTGVSLVLIEDGTPGFNKGRKLEKMGLHNQDTAEMSFEDCRIPQSNLLGVEGQGFTYLMEKLARERLMCAYGSQLAAEMILKGTIAYTKERKQFGKPICKFQHNSFKIVEMATEIELGKVFMKQMIDDHLDGKDVTMQACMGKWWISEMANRVAYNCLQLFGGYGYMEEYVISRAYRDIRIFTIFAGTTEIMKWIISKQMGL